MERKEFTSRLFRKKIVSSDPDYWQFLYAEIMFRQKVLKDLNCPCSYCFADNIKYKNLLKQMVEEGHIHITGNYKPDNFTGIGDCGRRLGPAA